MSQFHQLEKVCGRLRGPNQKVTYSTLPGKKFVPTLMEISLLLLSVNAQCIHAFMSQGNNLINKYIYLKNKSMSQREHYKMSTVTNRKL